MNTIRFVVAWISCGVSVLCVGWIIGLNDNPVPNGILLKRVLAVIFFLILAAVFFALAEYFRKSVKWLPQASDRRPVVRVWTHNSITGVVAEDDWNIYHLTCEREFLVGPPAFLPHRRPQVPLTSFFASPEINLDVFWVGSLEDCATLLSKCRVEKTEMFIPHNLTPEDIRDYGFVPIDLSATYRLIFGADANLPEKAS